MANLVLYNKKEHNSVLTALQVLLKYPNSYVFDTSAYPSDVLIISELFGTDISDFMTAESITSFDNVFVCVDNKVSKIGDLECTTSDADDVVFITDDDTGIVLGSVTMTGTEADDNAKLCTSINNGTSFHGYYAEVDKGDDTFVNLFRNNEDVPGGITVSVVDDGGGASAYTYTENADFITAQPFGSLLNSNIYTQVYNIIDVSDEVTGTARAGGDANHIKLAAGASAVNDYYKNWWLHIDGGAGAGQVRMIESYDGTTKLAEVYEIWDIGSTPDQTSTYKLLPNIFMFNHAMTGFESVAGFAWYVLNGKERGHPLYTQFAGTNLKYFDSADQNDLEADTVTQTTITDAGSTWTVDAFDDGTYYAAIKSCTSGGLYGQYRKITNTAANVLTLQGDNWEYGLPEGTIYFQISKINDILWDVFLPKGLCNEFYDLFNSETHTITPQSIAKIKRLIDHSNALERGNGDFYCDHEYLNEIAALGQKVVFAEQIKSI